MATGRLGERTAERTRSEALAPMPGTVRCNRCGDAGWLRNDTLAVGQAGFGIAYPCPDCEGARKARNPVAEYRWFLARDKATMPRLPQAVLPPYTAEPPPQGFAKTGVPVPSMVGEAERERARKLIAQNVAAIAKKMKGGAA